MIPMTEQEREAERLSNLMLHAKAMWLRATPERAELAGRVWERACEAFEPFRQLHSEWVMRTINQMMRDYYPKSHVSKAYTRRSPLLRSISK